MKSKKVGIFIYHTIVTFLVFSWAVFWTSGSMILLLIYADAVPPMLLLAVSFIVWFACTCWLAWFITKHIRPKFIID